MRVLVSLESVTSAAETAATGSTTTTATSNRMDIGRTETPRAARSSARGGDGAGAAPAVTKDVSLMLRKGGDDTPECAGLRHEHPPE
jgi:hypothetical protein